MPSHSKLRSFLKIIQFILPAFGLLYAVVVMWAWISSQNVFLIQIQPTYAPMQFNTALLFACISLVTLTELQWPRLANGLASFVFLFASATLSQYLTNTNLGLDQFFSEYSIMVLTSHPGRMAPQTAFVFILLSIGHLLRRFDYKLFLFSDMNGLLAASVSLLGVAGYFTNASIAFAWGNFSKMALSTSVIFVLLSATLLITNFLQHTNRWRLAPYLVSSTILFAGLTLWVAYFDGLAKTSKAEVNATIFYEGELLRGLVDDRMKSMNRMAERFARTGPDQNWKIDLKNYFENYRDLKSVTVGPSSSPKNQKVLTDIREMNKDIDVEYKSPFTNSRNRLPLYYYNSTGLRSIAFEIDFSEVINQVLSKGKYFTSLRIGKQVLHAAEVAPAGIDEEWGQEIEFQLPSINFILRKTPSLEKIASNQAGLSLFLIAIIFSAAVWAAYSIQLNHNLRENKEALGVTSSKLKALIAALPFGVFQTDQFGKCIFVSEKWCELTGLNPSKAYGDGWIDALHPDDREAVFTEWAIAIHSKKEFQLKYRFLQKNGNIIWVQGKAVALADESGANIGSIGGVLDITSEVAQQHLVEAQKIQLVQGDRMRSLGQMAGGIAHEINNPLAVIELNVNLIREMAENNILDNQFAVSTTNKISNIINRISAIIRGLRAFARDGNQDPFTNISINDVIVDTLLLCKDRFEKEQVQLSFENFDRSIMVNCRPAQVSQVIVNLLGNALDAVAPLKDPWVKIELSVDSNWIYVSVIDSGLGIPASIQEKIMDPFFTTKEIGKGTGLGLSISMGIMKSHDGSLDYDSKPANTTFIMKFPKLPPFIKDEDEKTT